MLGTVTMLRRYPVKSMLGEDVPASDVTGKGLAHDRALALVHRETGKVASAKNPRLWRGMLKLAAAVDPDSAVAGPGVAGPGVAGPGVRITLPDGKTVWSADPGIDAVLSEVLGRPVTLTGTPPPNADLLRFRADPPAHHLDTRPDRRTQPPRRRRGGALPAQHRHPHDVAHPSVRHPHA